MKLDSDKLIENKNRFAEGICHENNNWEAKMPLPTSIV